MGYVHGRLIGRDVELVWIDSVEFDLTRRYQDCGLDVRVERQDVTVVKDGPRRSRAAHYNWRTTLRAVVEDTAMLLTRARVNYFADMLWHLETGTDPGVSGHAFDGVVGPSGFNFPLGEGAQTEGSDFDGSSELWMDDIPLIIYPDSAPTSVTEDFEATPQGS